MPCRCMAICKRDPSTQTLRDKLLKSVTLLRWHRGFQCKAEKHIGLWP